MSLNYNFILKLLSVLLFSQQTVVFGDLILISIVMITLCLSSDVTDVIVGRDRGQRPEAALHPSARNYRVCSETRPTKKGPFPIRDRRWQCTFFRRIGNLGSSSPIRTVHSSLPRPVAVSNSSSRIDVFSINAEQWRGRRNGRFRFQSGTIKL